MKKINFKVNMRSGLTTITTGWQLRCGAVVHRSVFAGGPKGHWPQRYDDCWAVSDPVSGFAFVQNGWSMGDAFAKFRRLQSHYGARFSEALALARQNTARRALAERAAP